MSVEVHTVMGTRVLLLADGSRLILTKDESELVKLRADDGMGVSEFQLTQSDCLALIEFLAVAARPHSGKPLLDALPEDLDGGWLDTLCSVCSERQYVSPSGTTCNNGHGGAPPKDSK